MMSEASSSSALRNAFVNVRRWILIALVTLLVGEGITRVFGVLPLTNESILWRAHPTRGWEHRPGAEDIFVKPGFSQHIAINSKGLRERDIPYERTPGVTRILVIGDSSVVSFEVEQEEVFTRVAEDVLKDKGYPVEIINGGFRGYGTDQSLTWLREDGLKYSPDIVIYKWTNNDREDNATVHRPFRKYGKAYYDLDDQGNLVLNRSPVPTDYPYDANLRVGEDGEVMELGVPQQLATILWLRDYVLCNSSFATALTKFAISLPSASRPMQNLGTYDDQRDVKGKAKKDPTTRLARVTVALIQEMQRVSNESGADFRMIYQRIGWGKLFGKHSGVVDDIGDWDRYLSRLPENPKDFHTLHDPHWNALGHQAYGESLAEGLIESGLLEKGQRVAVAPAE